MIQISVVNKRRGQTKKKLKRLSGIMNGEIKPDPNKQKKAMKHFADELVKRQK